MGDTDAALDRRSHELLQAIDELRQLEEAKRETVRSTRAFHDLSDRVAAVAGAVADLAASEADASAEDSPLAADRREQSAGGWTRASQRRRVAIVEDHPAIADGLAALVATADDLECVGVALDAGKARDLIETERPDVVLSDVMVDGRDLGFELVERYGRHVPVVLYSAFDYPAHHVRAVQGGAAGYVSKGSGFEVILSALRRATSGDRAFSRDVIDSARRAPRPPTPRERELLELLVDGATNDEAAGTLGLRVKTIEGMIRRMFDRYDVANRTQLTRLASTQGWLTSRRTAGTA